MNLVAHHLCRRWARELRRVAYGSRGWPGRMILALLAGLGFTSAKRWECDERNPPALDGAAAEIMRAITRLDRVHRDILFAHYILDGTAIDKARVLGISRRAYYARLDRASHALANRLDGSSRSTVDGRELARL